MCVKCGKTKGIEAHHIIPGLEELDNLVTLCHACHKKEHNMAGCFGYNRKVGQPRSRDNMIKIGENTQFKKGHSFVGNQYIKV